MLESVGEPTTIEKSDREELERLRLLYADAIDHSEPKIFRESLSPDQKEIFDSYNEEGQINIAALGWLKEKERNQLRFFKRSYIRSSAFLHNIGNAFELYDAVTRPRSRRPVTRYEDQRAS